MAWNWVRWDSDLTQPSRSFRHWKRAPARRQLHSLPIKVEFLEERLVLTPAAEEQLFVYLLNKIRSDPEQYAQDAGLGNILDNVEPRQPLAVNDALFASAELHANEMALYNYFAHQSEFTGKWPNTLAVDQGYSLPNYFDLHANNIESIAAGTTLTDPADVIKLLIVDANTPGLEHRDHLLGIDDFNAQAREIGVGHGFDEESDYQNYWAAHITFSNTVDTFLTGVVYDDTNHDHQFSLGEGLPNVTISMGGSGLVTQTNAAGGWSLKVPSPGTYTVNVNGVGFTGVASSTVVVGDLNREIDFVSGSSAGVVDFGVHSGAPNQAPVNTVPAGPLNIQEDVPFSIAGLSVDDPDAAAANVSVTLSVSHGKLRVPTNVVNGITSGQVAGNNSGQVVLTAPLSKINATLANSQGLVYTGLSNYNGDDVLTVVTNDLGHTGSGAALSDTDTVDLLIDAVNDAPVNVLPAGTHSVVTGATLNVTGIGLSDVDLGSQPAAVILAVQHGTISIRTDVGSGLTSADVAGNGTNSVTITAPLSRLQTTFGAQGGVTYVSDNAYIGSDTLTMTSSDLGNSGAGGPQTDQSIYSIQVQAVPIPPVLTLPGTPATGSGGLPVVAGAGATITDADSPNFSGAKLTIQITAGAQATDSLILTKVGHKAGQLNLKKTNIRLGKIVIGQFSGGKNGSPLEIKFTSSVTLSDVQTVLQRVTLKASKRKLLAGTRTVQFAATDPTHATSLPQTREVSVTT